MNYMKTVAIATNLMFLVVSMPASASLPLVPIIVSYVQGKIIDKGFEALWDAITGKPNVREIDRRLRTVESELRDLDPNLGNPIAELRKDVYKSISFEDYKSKASTAVDAIAYRVSLLEKRVANNEQAIARLEARVAALEGSSKRRSGRSITHSSSSLSITIGEKPRVSRSSSPASIWLDKSAQAHFYKKDNDGLCLHENGEHLNGNTHLFNGHLIFYATKENRHYVLPSYSRASLNEWHDTLRFRKGSFLWYKVSQKGFRIFYRGKEIDVTGGHWKGSDYHVKYTGDNCYILEDFGSLSVGEWALATSE